jgi:MiaB/RimO family radical SAM methylthiotransferase
MKSKHTVCVLANGCPENRIDAAQIQEYFKENGQTITFDYRAADLIVFNACGATQYSQDGAHTIIKEIQAQKRPHAEFIVCGCLPKINKTELDEVLRGGASRSDVIRRFSEFIETMEDPQYCQANYLVPIISGRNIPKMRDILSLLVIPRMVTRVYYYRFKQGINNITPRTYCVKVSSGCLHACAFCAIRHSRGKVRSKPIDQILHEFEKGYGNGYREFTLIGTDLGAYGRDRGTSLAGLLREMVKKKGDYEIRLQYIQPRFFIEMLPELLEIFREGKIWYLCSAAESGNDRILQLMRRGYRIEDFKEAILAVKRGFPKMKMSTQVIVGYPGETASEFQDTVRFLDDVRFDFVEAHLYQPRPNTAAARSENQIPPGMARRRLLRLYTRSLLKGYKVFIY